MIEDDWKVHVNTKNNLYTRTVGQDGPITTLLFLLLTDTMKTFDLDMFCAV